MGKVLGSFFYIEVAEFGEFPKIVAAVVKT
jgi:hypothetical protein